MMSHDPFVSQILSKMKQYEARLEKLNDEIDRLTKERDALTQGHAAYQKILQIETDDQGSDADKSQLQINAALGFDQGSFSNLSIPGAAEQVLKDSRRALSNSDLLREIKRRGKSMEGPNVYNVLYSSLKRNPSTFKKQGNLWTLVNKNLDTKAA